MGRGWRTTNFPRPVKAYNQYSLEELNALSFWGRIQRSSWQLEYITIGFIVIFVVLFKVGDKYNEHITLKYLKGLRGVLKDNFFQVGVDSEALVVRDSAENYSSYATGRKNIAKVNVSVRLQPRHNVFVWILEIVMSFFSETVVKPEDKVYITITPSNDAQYDNFISAVVSKLGMNTQRKHNYYLSLTKTNDSASLPESFVFMSEVNEIQDKTLTAELRDALTLQSASYLKYVAFTDQGSEKPESIQDLIPRRRIVVCTDLVTGKDQLEQLSRVLAALFQAVDRLAEKEIVFKPETLRKVVKTREVEVAKIEKIKEAIREEQLAAEKAKERKEEKERLRSMSREEQIKAEKKAQEKKQRKLQKKNKVRM